MRQPAGGRGALGYGRSPVLARRGLRAALGRSRTRMQKPLENNHRAAAENLVALAPTSEAYGPEPRTALGIDECLAHPALGNAVHQLIQAGDVFMATPMWQELRRQKSGKIISTGGGGPIGEALGLDWGVRLPGDHWPDDRVVAMALGSLYVYRRVIILSANRKGDRAGLRVLLHQEVGPVLNRDGQHGLTLAVQALAVEAPDRRGAAVRGFTPGPGAERPITDR